MSPSPDQPRPPAPGPRGRLLTPGLAWLVGSLGGVLGLLVVLGVTDPDPPNGSDDLVTMLANLGIWTVAVVGLAASSGGAIHGLLLLGAQDREEAIVVEEAPIPRPHPRERRASRALAAGGAIAAAIALAVASLLEAEPSLALILVSAGIGLYGLIAAFLIPLTARAQLPGAGARTDWAKRRHAGLDRPIPHLHLGLLILLTLVAVGLQLTLIEWVVEDAAISFAYAKHLAAGEGLVTFPGGERVEGYSNPLWTFLLAAFYAVGIDGFVSNKIMGAVFAALTVPLTWAIAREARPHRADATPLIAAALLAGSAQFAIWGAGGLENSLLNVLIAGATWRALVEGRRGGIPFSALLWLGVAITRPEGILYAAAGGFWTMVYRAHRVSPELRAAWSEPARLPGAVWRATAPTIAWLALFFLPFGLYHAWRYDYFAWELPNTYYAKKANPGKAFEPYSWTRKGWKYFRDWSHHLGHAYLMPVYMVGALGTKGMRSMIGMLLLLAVFAVMADPSPKFLGEFGVPLQDPEWWVPVRVWVLLLAGLIPAFAAIGRPGWRAISLSVSLAVGALFFAVYAGGDWMNGFRWMSSFAVPGAVLLAVGISELAERARGLDRSAWWLGAGIAGFLALIAGVGAVLIWIPPMKSLYGFGEVGSRDVTPWIVLGTGVMMAASIALGRRAQIRRHPKLRWGGLTWALVFALLGVATVPSITRLDKFLARPTTSPWSVKRRVDYMNQVQERLHMDRRPVNLDVDMGANMYWSGDRIVDIAGLVDVSMGHHWFDKPFIAQYIFEEERPDFAHVHGGWASTSKLTRFDEWEAAYIEIPPYKTGSKDHPGNHVRKDLIVQEGAPGPTDRATMFTDGLVLEGWDVPAGSAAPGRHVYLELAWSTPRERAQGEDFRAIVFLVDGDDQVAHSWSAAPGFDYYHPNEWEPDEIIVGRYSLPLPTDLQHGVYGLGVAVISDPRGETIPALGRARQSLEDPGVPPGAILAPDEAVLMRGEIRWSGALEVKSVEAVDADARTDVATALAQADDGRCEEAGASWWLARRRTTRSSTVDPDEGRTKRAIANCWAVRASGLAERDARVDAFARSHTWDHHAEALLAGRGSDVQALWQEGMEARARKDWKAAYRAFHQLLRIEPTRSWARRYAIEALDCKLRIRLERHDCGFDGKGDKGPLVPVGPLDGKPGRGLQDRARPPMPPSLRMDTDR